MKNVIIIALIFFFGNSFAQEKVIEVETEKEKNSIKIFCKNNSKYTQEVTLTLKNIKGLRGYKKPIKKLIKPKSKILFYDLSFKDKYSYSSSTSYRRIITEEEKIALEKKKNELLLQDFEDINKGIIVFEKTGCARCTRATSYMLDNNIKFKMLNITSDMKSRELMWKLLKDSGHEGRVTTPVILVNGKLSHSHKDLKGFLEGLKK